MGFALVRVSSATAASCCAGRNNIRGWGPRMSKTEALSWPDTEEGRSFAWPPKPPTDDARRHLRSCLSPSRQTNAVSLCPTHLIAYEASCC